MAVSLQVVRSESTWDTFWTHYPRKVAKKAAARIWMRLSEVEKDAALQALPSHCRQWAGKDSQFIPHPATWLNQARWEDEIEQDHFPCKWRGCEKPGTVQNGTGKYCDKHYACLMRGETPR